MHTVSAREAKNLLGQVIDRATTDLVMIERHGKEAVALLPAAEARLSVLSAYAMGVLGRSVAMQRLGFTWYGQLLEAMQAAGLSVQVPAEAVRQMDAALDEILDAG